MPSRTSTSIPGSRSPDGRKGGRAPPSRTPPLFLDVGGACGASLRALVGGPRSWDHGLTHSGGALACRGVRFLVEVSWRPGDGPRSPARGVAVEVVAPSVANGRSSRNAHAFARAVSTLSDP